MLSRYVVADLLRNPRRTLSTMVGVTLGVGLFCSVLFFIDGLSASMTQRAVAPLAIDMQRIVTERVGGALTLEQDFDKPGTIAAGDRAQVRLEVRNTSEVAANEVVVRSVPAPELRYVPDSATLDGAAATGSKSNPFAQGPGEIGLNLGTIPPGAVRRLTYDVDATAESGLSNATVKATFSSRESVRPVGANQRSSVPLDELAHRIALLDGVAHASQLSFADLGLNALSANGTTVSGAAKIFGFDADYASRDTSVRLVDGELTETGGVFSSEAAKTLGLALGDQATVNLPDGSRLDLTVSGIADLSRARSLFSSRRGGDLETFVYTSSSVVVSPNVFAGTVLPAYERAATTRGERLKTPPVREIDVTLDRDQLNSDPATALGLTRRIAGDVNNVATKQDYLLDNISNTLDVASADAAVAKRLFVFLGVPGGLLAAFLAAYAGSILAQAQRREQATLRVRGASRRHLLWMLALRTALLTAAGAALGLVMGYVAVLVVLGQESLSRASSASLVSSALVGTVGGLLATGAALFLTGWRGIDQEINEDRARLATRPPGWRRLRLDLVGGLVVVVSTVLAVRGHAFEGASGSVYFGRAVSLNVTLLVLPVAVWITGSLLAARICGYALTRSQPRSTSAISRPLPSLFRLSVGRRPWSIANGAVVVSLIVAVAVSLAIFTASYDRAKVTDARFATGSDLRITPGPASTQTYGVGDAKVFRTAGVAESTPVIYAVSNVILRSQRTSDPASVAAIRPEEFVRVAPVSDQQFTSGDMVKEFGVLEKDPTALLISTEMAAFLKVKVGDPIRALLVRATSDQVEVVLHVTGTFDRLPGFPEGADAVMSIELHADAVPSKSPDFFLASTTRADDRGLERAFTSLRQGPGSLDLLQIDTRKTTLASDQSSLAALNIAGLVLLDQTFALGMATVAIGIFVFGLLLQRRREYITMRAQGLDARTIRLLIAAEAGAVAVAGATAGLVVGGVMGYYFINVLRPLFVLTPRYTLPIIGVLTPVTLVLVATVVATIAASRLVHRLEPTELLRDE